MNNQKRTYNQFLQSLDSQDSGLLKIGPQELAEKFKSKQDLYTYFTEILGYYLPPHQGVNRDFLRQILSGQKLLMKMSEVKLVKVPKYDELSVRLLYKQVIEDCEILKYLPDMNEKSKPIDREFFFNVINTLQPDYLQHIVKQSQEKRNNPQNNNQGKDYILISDDWFGQLTSHPFVSSKQMVLLLFFLERPGRTMQLLKASAKIFKSRKPKQQPASVISLKRFRDNDIGHSTNQLNRHIENIRQNDMNSTLFETQSDAGAYNQTEMRFNI